MSLTQSMIFPSRQNSLFAPARVPASIEEIRRTTIQNLMKKNHPCNDLIQVLTKDGEGLKSGFYDPVLFKIIRRLSAFIRQTADLKQKKRIGKLLRAIKALHKKRMRSQAKHFEVDIGADPNLQKKHTDKISTAHPVDEKYLILNNSSANFLEYLFPGKCEPEILFNR